jgi:hypothetical protein
MDSCRIDARGDDMKQMTFATGLALVWCAATLAGQQAAAPPNQVEPAHKVFVVTGCLERGSAPSAFRLTRASAVGQVAPPASPNGEDGNAYDLQATSSVSEQGFSNEKLLPEVGTRVEVTIRPVEVTSPAPPRTVTPGAAEKPVETPRPRYTVVMLERLAGKCA